MASRLILIFAILAASGVPITVSSFDLKKYCAEKCAVRRGGNLCDCNVVHFAGKRTFMRPNSRAAILARYANWRQSRMTLGRATPKKLTPSLLGRFVVLRPFVHRTPSKNALPLRYGLRPRPADWKSDWERLLTSREPSRRFPNHGAYPYQRKSRLNRKSGDSTADRLI